MGDIKLNFYLPIAEVSVNIYSLVGIGFAIGWLSGLLGVGGGFLLTPMLMFLGIPAPITVATLPSQIAGQSFAGVITHFSKQNVDIKMGLILIVGGFLGSSTGVYIFSLLKQLGQIDLIIRVLYVIFLTFIGLTMLIETTKTLFGSSSKKVRKHHHIGHRLPFKMRFNKSKLYMSALLPLLVGFFVGLISSLMGVGGGFILIPAIIYIIGMPTKVAIGTSLFQIMVISSYISILHAVTTKSMDIVLSLILLIGGVIGMTIGAMLGSKLKAEHLRIALSVVILLLAGKLFLDLVIEPNYLFSYQTFESFWLNEEN